jgi:hypothetical protein
VALETTLFKVNTLMEPIEIEPMDQDPAIPLPEAQQLVDEKAISLLALVADLAERESDRGWKRQTMMINASTGLVAILTFSASTKILLASLPPALVGIAIAIAWLKTNNASYYYEHRWHADMEAVIEANPLLAKWVRGRNRHFPRIPRNFRSGAIYFNVVPWAFLLLWLSIVFVVAVLILNPAYYPAIVRMGKGP